MNGLFLENAMAAEAITLESSGIGYAVLTLLLAVIVPLLSALALFVFLRRADLKSRLLVFFICTAVYVICDVFVFSDFAAAVKLVSGATVHPVCGFILAVAAGIIFTGFCLLLCSAGITKLGGRIPMFVFTVLAAAAASAVFCANIGVNEVAAASSIPIASSVFTGEAGRLGSDLICVLIYLSFIALSFLCFVFNRSPREIAENEKEYQIRLNRRRHGVAGTEKDETRCATCQYSRLMKTDSSHVICDTNGIVDCNHICSYFLYDPLKRIPKRPPSPYESAPSEEAAEAVPAEHEIPEVPDISDAAGTAQVAEPAPESPPEEAEAGAPSAETDVNAEKSAEPEPGTSSPAAEEDASPIQPEEKKDTSGMAAVFERLSRKNKTKTDGENADAAENEHE